MMKKLLFNLGVIGIIGGIISTIAIVKASSTNNFYLTADDNTPSTNQRIDLTVKARDGSSTDTSYRGTIQFEVYYKSSSSSKRTKTTSSTYYEMDSNYKDKGYTFTSSNKGTKTFSKLMRFKKNNYSYKVLVYDKDDDNINGYKIFTVGNSSSSSDTDCRSVKFSNGITACVNIENISSDRWKMTTDVDGGSTSNLRCDIMTPDSKLKSLSTCNGEFTYNGSKVGRIKLRIRYDNTAPTDRDGKPGSNSTRTYPQWVYDRNNKGWVEDKLSDEDTSNSESFSVIASPSNPDENEPIDITVKAKDGSSTNYDYDGTVRFKVERWNTSTNERVTASSSLYELNRTSYKFDSNDDGVHKFNDLVTFKNDSYDYRLLVYDDDNNIDGYKIFDFGNGYDEDDEKTSADNFYIITSTSSPNKNQYVDVTIKAREGSSTDENYRGTIRFKVERKSGSSRTTASSSYYTLSETSYKFTSSDNGIHEFTDLIKFNNDSYDYRLKIYDDENNIEAYKIFYVNSDKEDNEDTDYDTNNFSVTASNSSPKRNEYIDLTIKAKNGSKVDTSYRGTVQFEIRYRESGYNSRTKTTSLSYYEMKYPYEDNGYRFTSSNKGEVTITDFIRFKREGYEYKIVVYDKDNKDIDGYKTFTIDNNEDSNTSSDNFYLTTDDSTPTTNQRVDLTVKARKGTSTNTAYRGTIQFEVYYKSSSSSTWTKTTSSTYYEMDSDYEDNGYTFTSSNNGTKTFNNLIRFKKNNYSYKVVVYDEDDEDIQGYKTFTVGSSSNNSSSSVDGFTTSQLNTVKSIHDAWENMIDNLENTYSKLRTNSRRQTMSDNLYEQMGLILDDDDDRIYDNFDEFYAAFLDRYRYTVSVR